jgi:serine/threonine protein kinase
VGASQPIPFGRYTLVERLAVGGMAELFLGTAPGEHGFQRQVVIKRLLPNLARDPVYTAMFIDEAKLTARLSHPKIAQTYELGRVGAELFIAMEFVDGVDVLAMLRELAWQRRRMPVELAVWVTHEVLDALDFAHNLKDENGDPLGIVHRDISPSNVLLSRRGDVKLVDFGIARAVGPGRHHRTKSGTLKGKYGYMSPEQVIEQPVDARSDLFSVGVVLAEMLCGRRLFAASAEIDVLLMVRDAKLSRLDQYGAHIPGSLDALLRKSLSKDPEDRHESAAEMRDALAEWLFEERKRVTPKHIGELVDSLYESAWKRRRETMAQTAAEAASAAAAAEQAVSAGLDGVPGKLEVGESMPIISIEATPVEDETDPNGVNELSELASADLDLGAIASPAQSVDVAVDSGPVALVPPPPAPSTRAPTVDGRKGSPAAPPAPSLPPPAPTPSTMPGRMVVTIPPLPTPASARGNAPVPITRAKSDSSPVPVAPIAEDTSGKVSIAAQATVSAAGFLDTDFGELAGDIEKAVLQLQSPVPAAVELDASVRYGSIEDAISSISPETVDPSVIDFDDSNLEDKARRSRPIPIPTPSEIHRVAAKVEPPPMPEISGDPTMVGDFSTTAPITLLYRLTTGRATGLLAVQVGGIKKEIYVRGGVAEYVSSNMAAELLGNYLVSRGALSPGELAMALAMMPHYGGKLGDTLVGLGLLKPLEVFRHLTYQVRQKLIDVCTWTKGGFAWYDGAQNERTAFPLDLNSFEVLGAGAMAMRDDTIAHWMIERAASTVVRSRPKPAIELERFEIAGLPTLFTKIDGEKTVGQLITDSLDPTAQRRTARMLILLEQCELVRTASLGL